MSRRALLAAGLAMLASCGEPPIPEAGEWSPSDHVQPESSDAPTSQQRRTAPRTERSTDPLAAAAALWNVTCASCHGRTGQGDGPAAPGPMVSFASPEWQQANDDAAITAVITQGRGLMPPFGETIAPAGIEALVSLIRRFGGRCTGPHRRRASPCTGPRTRRRRPSSRSRPRDRPGGQPTDSLSLSAADLAPQSGVIPPRSRTAVEAAARSAPRGHPKRGSRTPFSPILSTTCGPPRGRFDSPRGGCYARAR